MNFLLRSIRVSILSFTCLFFGIQAHVKHIVCDLGGVLITTNKLASFKQLGVRNCVRYWWNGGSLFDLEKTFFDFLETIEPHTQQTLTVRGPDGMLLPPLMCNWLCGVPTANIRKTIADSFSEQKELYHTDNKWHFANVAEYQMLQKIAQLIFDPKTFIKTQQLVPAGVQFIQKCKQAGHKVYILSNWDSESFDLLEQDPRFAEFINLFDGIVVSGDVGYLKPDQQMYKIMMECIVGQDSNAQPGDCIFIDDQPENLIAAEHCGFNTILCTHKKSGMFSSTPNFDLITHKMKRLHLL